MTLSLVFTNLQLVREAQTLSPQLSHSGSRSLFSLFGAKLALIVIITIIIRSRSSSSSVVVAVVVVWIKCHWWKKSTFSPRSPFFLPS